MMKRVLAALVTAFALVASVGVFVSSTPAGAVTGETSGSQIATAPVNVTSVSAVSSNEAATAQADVEQLAAADNPPSTSSVGVPCSVTTGGGHHVSGTCTCTDLGLGTFCFVGNCQVTGIHLVQQTWCYILNFGNTGYWTGTIFLFAGFATGYQPL
jgi:hypothetical protein